MKILFVHGGVARALAVGQDAHPEDLNEEENEENLRKNEEKLQEMRQY